MLYFAAVFSLLSVVYAESEGRPVIHLPPLVLDTIKKVAATCVKETEVQQEVSDNFFKQNFGTDAGSKKFIYCVGRKSNYADEDGHFNDAFITLFEGSSLKDDVQKAIQVCNKQKEKNNVETMFQVIQCFNKKTPVLLVV